MKFIFLDIDGVMNLNKTFNFKDKRDKKYGTDILEIDNKRVRMLKELINDTGAQVVLSSGWREGWAYRDIGETSISNSSVYLFNRLERYFKQCGIEFYDRTKPLKIERGKEIMAWLSQYKEPIESFVVFDDIAYDMGAIGDNFICTSMKTGLLPSHIEKAKQILNSEN